MRKLKAGQWSLANVAERTDTLERRARGPSGFCRLSPQDLAGRCNSIKPRPGKCYTVGLKGGILINFSNYFWAYRKERVPSPSVIGQFARARARVFGMAWEALTATFSRGYPCLRGIL